MGDGNDEIPILAFIGSPLLSSSAIEWPVRGRKNLNLNIISAQRQK